MANYVSRVASPHIPDYLVIKVSVPANKTITPGSVVPVLQLDTTITNNWNVYSGIQPATANLGVRMALILNDGFETLPDGRRPAGQPDYTQYTYSAGQVVTAVLLVPGLIVELSNDCVTTAASAVVTDYLQPVNGSYSLSRIANATGVTAGTLTALQVDYVNKNSRIGGNLGAGFVTGVPRSAPRLVAANQANNDVIGPAAVAGRWPTRAPG